MWVMVLTNNSLVLNNSFPFTHTCFKTLRIKKIILWTSFCVYVVMMHFCLCLLSCQLYGSLRRAFLVPVSFASLVLLTHLQYDTQPLPSLLSTPSYSFSLVPIWIPLSPHLCPLIFLDYNLHSRFDSHFMGSVLLLWHCRTLEDNDIVWFPTWNLFRLRLPPPFAKIKLS